MKAVRLGGAVAAGFGFLALLGWVLRLPFLASLGPDKIPMAPSTALLFVLYGIAAFLRTRPPLGREAYRVGVAVNSAGALVALLLLILSLLGIRPSAELLGFAAAGTVGGAPVGHMSPVVAACFLLASLSFLGSLPSSSSRPWRAEAAWWTAGLLLATGGVLLLAYLFGSPLFYGGSYIPPAATASIAFVALGTALLALAGREAGPPGRAAGASARVPYPLVLVFVFLAAGIVTVGGLYLRSQGKRYRAEVEQQLLVVAELKTSALVEWRAERLGDASLFLGNAPFAALVRRVFGDPQDAEAREQLRAWLAKVQENYRYDRVSLLDARGAERLAVPEGRAPVSSLTDGPADEVLRSGEVAFQDFYRDQHDQRVYLSVLVPILDGRSRALGTLALRIDPETYLYPFINRWTTPAHTAETLLVRRDGTDALFLNEHKFQKLTALTQRVPLANHDVAAVKAVLGQEGIVEARDYRGVPVIAALRAVPGSPWFLVARMDAAEVNAPLRERLSVMVFLVGGMLAAAAGGVGVLWREQRVRHFRERYAAEQERAMLIEGVADYAILMLDPDGQVVSWNAGAERLKGYRADEIIGQPFSRFYPEEDVARGKPAKDLETAGSEGRFEDEGWRVRKDGSLFWANAIITALRDETGQLRGFSKVTRDITERRHAEAALRQSEERFRLVWERATDGMRLTDHLGRMVAANEAFCRMMGKPQNEVEGQLLSTLYAEPDRARILARHQERFASHDVPAHLERHLTLWDGRDIWLEVSNCFVETDPARPLLLGVFRDVTDRKHAEAALRQSQKVEAIGRLAGGVAHDFNNILGVITGYGEMAQRQLGPEHPVRARVDQMVKAAARAAGLTRQLLAFSRKQVMQPKLLDLNGIVADTQKMLGRLIGEDIDVVVHPAPDLGTVMADPGQIEQVILNLAVNARDAMPKGGSLTLQTTNVDLDQDYAAVHPPVKPGRYVMLAVSDTGIGMDEETQQRIFEPFFTTKPEGEGTGLGLATVYGIVKQSGGYIWVYSEPGRGTTFKVYLPRVDEPSQAVRPAGPPAEAPRGSETILLVEDTETLREVIQETLEESGYTVLLASNGEEALALAREREGPIDLLLTDVVMPKLGGGDLAKLLAALRPGLRVLYMSGYTNGAILQHGVLGKGVMLLEKPFTGDKLAWTVREALDRPTAR